MAATDTVAASVFRGTSPLLTRRVQALVAGEVVDVEQAMLTAVTFQVFRDDGVQILDTGMDPGDSATLVVADTVYDTVQDGIDGGPDYNFAFQPDGSVYLPEAGRIYRLDVEFELTGGDPFDAAWDLSAENPHGVVGLRSLAALKRALGLTADTYSPVLVELLKRAAAYAKNYCHRDFERQTYTEYYDRPRDGRLLLNQYPAASVTEVRIDEDRVFGSDTLLATDDWQLLQVGRTGMLKLLNAGWPSWGCGRVGETVQVTYVAGYDEDSVPADLAGAVVDLAAAKYLQRQVTTSTAGAGGAVKSIRRGQSQITYMTPSESGGSTTTTTIGSRPDPYGVKDVLDLYREVILA